MSHGYTLLRERVISLLVSGTLHTFKPPLRLNE